MLEDFNWRDNMSKISELHQQLLDTEFELNVARTFEEEDQDYEYIEELIQKIHELKNQINELI